MWYVANSFNWGPTHYQMMPLSHLNATAAIRNQLRGHDTTHGGKEFPFCEDYGCGSILEIQKALDEPQIEVK